MDTFLWWVGTVVVVSSGSVMAILAIVFVVWLILQLGRAWTVGRLYRPNLRAACDNPVTRAASKMSFGLECMFRGCPTTITSLDGTVLWDQAWLDEKETTHDPR